MKTLKIVGRIFAIMQLILSVLVIYNVIETKMIPKGYIILASVVFVALFVLVFFFTKKKKKGFRISAVVISLLMCIIMCASIYYLAITNKTIDKVTGVKTEVEEINVYVAANDSAGSINDAVANNYVFATVATDDQTHIQETIDKIQADEGQTINTKQYESIFDLVADFDAGAVNCILCNKGTILALDSSEDYLDYSSGLKVIMEEQFEEEVADDDDDSTADKDHFCMYFSGIDTFGSVTQRSRSDVNIIAAVNNKTHTILLVSTPRDYYVPLSVSNGQKDKLTHAGIYGIDCSIDTLEMLYDIDISYYLRLNFSGFQDIIDKIGGIDVESEYSFVSETEEGTYSFTAGVNHLNGEQALGFARARHAFKDGDRQRGRNQMQVIKATIKKMESSDMLMNYSSVMDQMENSFQTSMEKDEVGYLVQSTISDGGWTVLTYSVGGADSTQKCYSLGGSAYVMEPNKDDVAKATELMNKVLNGESLTQDEINVYIESQDAEDVKNGTFENNEKNNYEDE